MSKISCRKGSVSLEIEGDGVGDLPIKEESCFYTKNSMQKEYSS